MLGYEESTSILIITSSLETLRVSRTRLNQPINVGLAEALIDGTVDKECPVMASRVKLFAKTLESFREARAFFMSLGSSLGICCEVVGLNAEAVRDKLRPETQLEFNTLLAGDAVASYMDYRRGYVNK